MQYASKYSPLIAVRTTGGFVNVSPISYYSTSEVYATSWRQVDSMINRWRFSSAPIVVARVPNKVSYSGTKSMYTFSESKGVPPRLAIWDGASFGSGLTASCNENVANYAAKGDVKIDAVGLFSSAASITSFGGSAVPVYSYWNGITNSWLLTSTGVSLGSCYKLMGYANSGL